MINRRLWLFIFCLCLPGLAGCVHQHYESELPTCATAGMENPLPASVDDSPSQLHAQRQSQVQPQQQSRQQSRQQSQQQAPELVPVAVAPQPDDSVHSGIKHRISAYLVSSMQSKKLHHYQVREMDFPSTGVNGQPDNRVRVRFYQGDVVGPAPLVVVLPIWGTFDYPVEKLSLRLRNRFKGKVHIALVLGSNRLIKWHAIAASVSRKDLLQQSLESADQVRIAAADIRALLRWARLQPEIDPERMVLSGFSIGAIVTSIVTVEEPALAGTTLVMGAVNPAVVMASCNHIAGDSRLAAMNNLDMSLQEYENIMHQAFDALNWVQQGVVVEDPSRFLIVDAHHDDCMPQQARDALWLGLGKPERYTLKGSHQGAFLSMTIVGLNYTSKLLVDYIEQRFETLNVAKPRAPGCSSD